MDTRLVSKRYNVTDSAEAVYELACGQGWTDGLPVIPPTADRVERMLAAAAGASPQEVVAKLAPSYADATLEKIAINAVMAGCLPSYFPVVVAAVEAIADPAFELEAVQTTTNPVAVTVVINGPIRSALDINCGPGCMGPGWRANATIGRAIRLIQLNIGGSIPQAISQSSQGQPGRYTMCIGEYQERSPWEPLHVERGFKVGESTVTVFQPTGTSNILDTHSATAHEILTLIAGTMDQAGSNTFYFWKPCESLVLLCPYHADIIARDGLSKSDVKRWLYQKTKNIPLSKFPEKHKEMLISANRVAEEKVSLFMSPEQVAVVVAGGEYHSQYHPSYSVGKAVTKRIRVQK